MGTNRLVAADRNRRDEHLDQFLVMDRKDKLMSDDTQAARKDTTVSRVYFHSLAGAFAVTEDGKEWRLSCDEIKNALNSQPITPIRDAAAGALEPLSEEERLRKVLQNFADQMLTDEMELDSSGDFEGAYDIMIKMARSALSSAHSNTEAG
jgi:hypothetical protein